jgi:hypothetical protein
MRPSISVAIAGLVCFSTYVSGKACSHTSMNGRSPRLDDD